MSKVGNYLYGRLLDFDFLGAPVGFHMKGKKTHDTLCGSIVSIGIIATVFLYVIQLGIAKRNLVLDPVVIYSDKHGHFGFGDHIGKEKDGFDFGIAVTSYHG